MQSRSRKGARQVEDHVLGQDDGVVSARQAASIRTDDSRLIAEDRYRPSRMLTTSDGERFFDDSGRCAMPTAGSSAVPGTLRDITRSKVADLALQASEERYRMSLDNAADAVLVANPEGDFIYANQMASQILATAVSNCWR
jgi:PAS domain-containing protein